MRALTLTQPWAGLVASGIKLVENRPRRMIKAADLGKPFAIHASREIDEDVYTRIREIAPDVAGMPVEAFADWFKRSRVTSAVIAVATLDKELHGGWNATTIRQYEDIISFSDGEILGPQQTRWFFGPIGYLLRDVRALATPVPCKGALGFWTLPADVEARVMEQL